MKQLQWTWLGRVGYRAGVELLERQRERVLAGDEDAERLYLLEHDPVITLGRRANPAHVVLPSATLSRMGVDVVQTTRGGDVTYHGPGQLMVYPVVRLRNSIIGFLESLAGALTDLASELGVPGCTWQRDPAGLWLGTDKLAACGLHVRRGVSIHGWAFNVSTPAEAWRMIVPCGLSATGVTSIADRSAAPDIADVAARAVPHLCRALDRAPAQAAH